MYPNRADFSLNQGEANGVSLASILGSSHMISLYKQATVPTLQLVTGW